MKLTNGRGNQVVLGGRLGAGGEAEILSVIGSRDLVAKIYHQPSRERLAKLQAMISDPPIDPKTARLHRSICWPISLLFDSQGNHKGFLMPNVDSTTNLPVYRLYNPRDRQAVAPGFTWAHLLQTAANIANAMTAIHSGGCVVGDVNESNILVSNAALISLVDCDSMQVPKPGTRLYFRCPVGKAEFTPPELQGKDFDRIDRTQEHDNFGLGVLIFQLLMEGTHPFSGIWERAGEPPTIEERIRRGYSPYSSGQWLRPMPGAPQFEFLPVSLQTLFQQCFRDGHHTAGARPTPLEWQNALGEAKKRLNECSRNKFHIYSDHLTNCPWCERTRLLGGFDPFPGSSQATPLRSPFPPQYPSPVPRPRPQAFPRRTGPPQVANRRYLPVAVGFGVVAWLGIWFIPGILSTPGTADSTLRGQQPPAPISMTDDALHYQEIWTNGAKTVSFGRFDQPRLLYTVDEGVNIRAAPTMDAQVITSAPLGMPVQVTGIAKPWDEIDGRFDAWYRVKAGELTGFAFGGALTPLRHSLDLNSDGRDEIVTISAGKDFNLRIRILDVLPTGERQVRKLANIPFSWFVRSSILSADQAGIPLLRVGFGGEGCGIPYQEYYFSYRQGRLQTALKLSSVSDDVSFHKCEPDFQPSRGGVSVVCTSMPDRSDERSRKSSPHWFPLRNGIFQGQWPSAID